MKLVVVGCGSMGSHLALAMSRGGHKVSVIDSDPSSKARLGPNFSGRFVTGVGIDLDALTEAGVEQADGLAAVTGNDDTNLAVAMVARKRFRVPQVAARVFDPGKLLAYRSAGIHVVCPPAWGFRVVGDILSRPSREIAMTFGHGEVQVVALTIGAARAGVLVRDLVSAPDVATVALVRNGIASVPPASAPLQQGDVLYVRVPETSGTAFDRIAAGLEG